MGAPAKFLFDVDFAKGADRKPVEPSITLAEHALKLAEAEAVYRSDLGYDGKLSRACQHPDNVWSLHGLHECLTRRGEKVETPLVNMVELYVWNDDIDDYQMVTIADPNVIIYDRKQVGGIQGYPNFEVIRRNRNVQVILITSPMTHEGKSTVASNLAISLAQAGRTVLLIDADPSGNATLGYFATGVPLYGLADLLLDEATLAEVVRPTDHEGLDVLPPGDRLSACSDQMGGAQGLGQGREFRIRRLLKQIKDYDFILVDTPPSLCNLLSWAALLASDYVLTPLVAEMFSAQALVGVQRMVERAIQLIR